MAQMESSTLPVKFTGLLCCDNVSDFTHTTTANDAADETTRLRNDISSLQRRDEQHSARVITLTNRVKNLEDRVAELESESDR